MEVRIERLDDLGRGIAYVQDKICFIENALPSEVVEIEIIQEHAKYLEARVVKYIDKSMMRIETECPYSAICGGCQLNHICYNEENKYKREKVKRILEKFAGIDSSIVEPIVYQDRNHYRNKMVLHGDGETIGYYQKNSHDIIPIQECLLVNRKINSLLPVIMPMNSEVREVMMKTSNDNSQLMVSIQGEMDHVEELKSLCDVLCVNDKYFTSQHEIVTSIGSKKYYESVSSFFQVNNTLTTLLYEEVLKEVVDGNYQTVLDLYCGTGTIGIYISDVVQKVIGVDSNPSNIDDASKNKELNGLENIEFICDKVENRIDSFHDIDFIIVDPPRAGLDSKTRIYLQEIKPKKILYVSCDPVTLARDLKELKETYQVVRVKPFNMFPRTYHCESVCILERK